MKNLIKRFIPMSAISFIRCIKKHQEGNTFNKLFEGIKDFNSQKWIYPHSKNDIEGYLYQLKKICEEIEIIDSNYFFYPLSAKLHRFLPRNVTPILSITPAYEEVLCTDFSVIEKNEVIKSLKILINRVIKKRSTSERFSEIQRLCKDILRPATSFEGAIQKILFFNGMLWEMGHGHNGLGRWDMVLYPYYKDDINKGVLTKEDARKILQKTIAMLSSQTHQKSATLYGDTGQYILIGGIDKNCRNVENELTFLFLNIFSKLNIPDPKLILRVNKHTSDLIYEEATKCIFKGNGSPLIFNDDKIIPLMAEFGYEEKDCYNVGTSACWEPLILGKSFDQNNNLQSINPVKAINNTLKGAGVNIQNFDDFMNQFYLNLTEDINECAHDLTMDCSPLFTLLFTDARNSHKDISKGGAKYAYHGMLVTGLPNAVNSLLNIKKLIFDEKIISIKECKDALRNNFENNKDLRAILKAQPLKFGKMDDSVISLTNIITDMIESIVSSIQINGKRAKVGFSSPNYITQAHEVGASMDGRYAGEPFSTHISPVGNNVDINEIINFASEINYKGCRINGNVVDFIIPESFNRHRDKFCEVVRRSIENGIYELQINVLSKATLIDARKHPEKYPELIVRVWGFSAYFNELPDEYKINLINRAEAYDC